MKIAIQSAVAGLRVSAQRLAVAAGNIVNAQSGGKRDPYNGYVPQQFVQGTTAQGAPRGYTRDVTPASVTAYQPGHPDADANGLTGIPNTDMASNIVDLQTARRSYESNLVALRTAHEMSRILLQVTA